MDNQLLNLILAQFKVKTKTASFSPISTGYINDTFLVSFDSIPTYILQRINGNVFKNIEQISLNIQRALRQLHSKDYQVIKLVETNNNKPFYKENTSYWRLMSFINDSVTHNYSSNPKIAFETGRILGCFHSLLQEEPISAYKDTLENFNNLPFRVEEFFEALEKASAERLEIAKEQIEFTKETYKFFDEIYNSNLPLRICHNDTKLNNILFNKNNEALCLIDLDTIMKGFFHYDFGDAIRTVVSESKEDETNLSKIKFNTQLFQQFIKGLNSNTPFLSQKEIESLPKAAALMPFIHGIRALTDFLNGNIYYKVSYENQNLDRCKSLYHFTKLALNNENAMRKVLNTELNYI